jgi:SAM-dependent methyltransferase
LSDYSYLGSELDLFAKALRWKAYWRSQLAPFIRGAVLEVGAGNGNNTLFLRDLRSEKWICLEPDAALAAELRAKAAGLEREVIVGTLAELPRDAHFDAILYLDVLEHIADDAGELRSAAGHLRPGGNLIVLAPAHQWLYSPFDRAIGHHRRYSRHSLHAVGPPELSLVSMRYLDSAGLIASLGNRFVLGQSMPKAEQLRFWDACLVPLSRALDPLLGFRAGKSIFAVWRRGA